MITILENAGWSRIDISPSALDPVASQLKSWGTDVQEFDLSPFASRFSDYIKLPEYSGEYRIYGGNQRHCFLEKAVEHFLSLEFAKPTSRSTGIDIGSCKSVLPAIVRREFGANVFEQDLEYTPGIQGDRIGSSADAIPMPDRSIDFMTLHCTFEHFEGSADTGFVRECARLLKPRGQTVILPLYLNANFCNVTGETNELTRQGIGFDPDAQYHCVIPEWQNRFGRHYSPASLKTRVLDPAREFGLKPKLLRVRNWDQVHPLLWLRWILVLQQPG